VPDRPALAIKVDNYPTARPQSGLDKADVVFEEPVEGLLTRFAAVFQCQQAALVGPVRSARAIDVGILSQLGRPILVHAGGIDPVLALIDQSSVIDVDLRTHPSVVQNIPGRRAPFDTYVSTAAIWNLEPDDHTPPAPLFAYSSTVPSGTRVSVLHIPFSPQSDVVWRYDAARGVWLRSYGSSPDILADGKQDAARNVVLQTIHITYGPWLENSAGGLEVQADLVGSGPVAVLRNGVEVSGTWNRTSLSSPTQLLDSRGRTIPLAPGDTWVELVPSITGWTASP